MAFTCQGCGECCKWKGTVRATDAELAAIAAHLGISTDDLYQRYMKLNAQRNGLIFEDRPDGACIFLNDANRCTIYPVRPEQCRSFPEAWDVPPDHQALCAGRRKQRQESQAPIRMVHVLGHPQRPMDTAAFPEDAQVLNCSLICQLLEHLRIPYNYYGCPGSRLPEGTCGHLVDCGKPTAPWKYRNAWHKLYTKRLSQRLAKLTHRDGRPELIFSLYGAAQSDVDTQGLPVVEPMVGYDHCWAPYRIFPSYSQQTALYALYPDVTQPTCRLDTVLPHFLPADIYHPTAPHGEDFLLFIGRDIPSKGIDLARQAAQAANIPLKIYHTGLHLEEKLRLLSQARAVLMPTLYLEPFGYVAIEAQLCGTPVIATDWGAFPETIIHGTTGFRCRTLAEFTQAIINAPTLDRNTIRTLAVERFDLAHLAEQYNSYFQFVWYSFNNGGADAYAAIRNELNK